MKPGNIYEEREFQAQLRREKDKRIWEANLRSLESEYESSQSSSGHCNMLDYQDVDAINKETGNQNHGIKIHISNRRY